MIIHADCVEAMQAMEPDSVDAIVCDPPYGLEFMGKEWDKLDPGQGRAELRDRSNFTPRKSTFKDGVGTNMGAPKKNPRCRRCARLKFDHATSKCQCEKPDWNTRTAEYAREMQNWHQRWAEEARRVLKPGGHLLAAGGTRTFHRLVCALEDAGFEIRDCIAHMYGSGFPKSLNLDRERCVCDRRSTETLGDSQDGYREDRHSDDGQPRPVEAPDQAPAPSPGDALGRSHDGQPQDGQDAGQASSDLGADSDHPSTAGSPPLSLLHSEGSPALGSTPSGTSSSTSPDESTAGHRTVLRTPDKSRSASDSPLTDANLSRCPDCNGMLIPPGLGTALKPAFEPWTLARKPLVGTVAANVLEHGTGALNIDGCRIGSEGGTTKGNPPKGESNGIYGDGINGACEIVDIGAGRWPPNLTLSHLPECKQTGTRKVKRNIIENAGGTVDSEMPFARGKHGSRLVEVREETIPAYSCAPGCPVAELDRQSGERPGMASQRDLQETPSAYFGADKHPGYREGYGDTGGASRFMYVAKASRAERNAGLEGFEEREVTSWSGAESRVGKVRSDGAVQNAALTAKANVHPTVKPIALMRWLVRLVTPKGGTVLDPFTGSGSTGVAAVLEGFDFVGIEREAEYVALAEARVKFWAQFPGADVDKVLLSDARAREIEASGQLGLL